MIKKKHCFLVSLIFILFAIVLVACNSNAFLDINLNTRVYQTKIDNGLLCLVNKEENECVVIGIGDCTQSDIVIPSSYKSIPVTAIEMMAFKDCTNLTSVIIPDSVLDIGYEAFYNCTNLENINVTEKTICIQADAFYGTKWYANQPNGLVYLNNVLYKYKGEMEDGTYIDIEEGIQGISGSAFEGCSGLIGISIPSSVKHIGAGAFDYTNLSKITVSNENENYTSLDGVLYNKKEKYIMHIPALLKGEVTVWDGVTEIPSYAFSGRNEMTEITIPNSVTRIDDGAFSGCSLLERIKIPDSVISFGRDVFEWTLWYNNQPDGLIYINDVAVRYKGAMLLGTNIVIKDGTVSIAGGAFAGCEGMTNIVLSNQITEIGEAAFAGCSGLSNIVIPNSTKSIGGWAFSECTNMQSITIPNSVTKIGILSFQRCEKLKNIYYGGTKSKWRELTEYMTWGENLGNFVIHCVDGDMTRTDWSI